MGKIKNIIIVILFSYSLLYSQDLKVISQDNDGITIQYILHITDTSLVSINNKDFLRIDILNGQFPEDFDFGSPAIPSRFDNIGVPSEFGNTISIINSTYYEINGEPIPKPFLKRSEEISEYIYEYNSEKYFNTSEKELVTFSRYGIARDLRVQGIQINPVQYFPQERKIRFYNNILFRIQYSTQKEFGESKSKEYLSDILLNFETAKNWGINKSNSINKTTSTNSVLSSGTWFKFEAPEEGIYRITKSQLSAYGINPDNVDPRTIKIYNNGGKNLQEKVSLSRTEDISELAIFVFGEDDGSFDDNDFILFYGRGTNFWDYNKTSKKIERNYHWYSKENYFLITSGGNQGKRIQNVSSLPFGNGFNQTDSKGHTFWEDDRINIGKTGRIFLGDEFNQNTKTRTYTSKLDFHIPNSRINYRTRFVNAGSASVLLRIEENSNLLFSGNMNGYGSSLYILGTSLVSNLSYTGTLPEERSVLRFTYDAQNVASIGYLDYFEIEYNKYLQAVNDQLIFYSKDTTALIDFILKGFSNSDIHLFDITDNSEAVKILPITMPSGGEFRFSSLQTDGNVKKYIAVTPTSYKSPINPAQIENSNYRGITEGSKLIIISDKKFIDQANRLKQHKENNILVPISTSVFDINLIYNEFNGGVRDVTAIRDFIKHCFNNWSVKPDYVLLFGDGTYDYKNIENGNNNFIPPYITVESLLELFSYPMDDFYVRVVGDDALIDLTIGRLNINTENDAKNVVDKIIFYETIPQNGLWKSNVTLVADDAFTSTGYEGSEHVRPSEILSKDYIPSSFDIRKIYTSNYPTVMTGFGRRKPSVNAAIIDAVNEGTLVLNFIGHGNPEVWTHEYIFEKSASIPQMNNSNYFFLVAATCDFGYFDKITPQSSSEELITKPNSGAIGVFSAARLVYSSLNHLLAYSFYNNIFNSPREEFNSPITVGSAYKKTKLIYHGTNDEKYHLFGDPTIRLKFPHYESRIDSLNGNALTNVVQVKSLGKLNIKGTVRKPNGTIWNDFNGEGLLTVFDSERTFRINEMNFDINLQGGIIFKGRVSVNNGIFNEEFIVPKDISYENKKGKIVFYFFNSQDDGIGYTDNIIVGGTETTAPEDNQGPKIDIYFDNISFQNAQLINPNSLLIVKLEDESGINSTGTGIGHKLEGILNSNENEPIDFTNYFSGDIDAGGRSGEIRYKFSNIENGEYSILIKAWDVYNNPSQEISYFTVVSGDNLVIKNVVNYPNPFSSNTTFTFQHNLDKPIDVSIKIYSVAGRLIHSIEKFGMFDRFALIDWDGRDYDGNIIANGTYLYKLIVKSTDGEFSQNVLGKLAVIK